MPEYFFVNRRVQVARYSRYARSKVTVIKIALVADDVGVLATACYAESEPFRGTKPISLFKREDSFGNTIAIAGPRHKGMRLLRYNSVSEFLVRALYGTGCLYLNVKGSENSGTNFRRNLFVGRMRR